PGIGSYENTLATAAAMNRLGERSVAAGFEKFFGHNHAAEFTTRYEHEGVMMSAWEILVAETNPEWVTFQLDVAWAADAGVDVPALIAEHGERIELLHIKDATNLGGAGNPVLTKLGEGDVDLQAILAAARDHAEVALYVLEYDVSPGGEAFAAEGVEYLTGQPAGEPAEPLEVSVETSARCVVGRTVLTARVTNGGGAAVTAEVASTFGTRSGAIGAGGSTLQAFTTRQAQVGAGRMLMTVTADIDGETVSEVIEVPYAASSCA